MLSSSDDAITMSRKYFPSITAPPPLPDSDPSQLIYPLLDPFAEDHNRNYFPCSFTSAVLQLHDRIESAACGHGAALGRHLWSGVGAAKKVRVPGGSAFTSVATSTPSTSEAPCSTSGYEEGDDDGEERSNGGGRRRKAIWSDMPKFLLAGAVSTVISRTCVAPLERIKLECITHGSRDAWTEVIRAIWSAEGVRGFWKGNALNLFRMVPFKSINLISYDMYCDFLLSRSAKRQITNRDRLVGGGISGVAATMLCLPLDTIRTRLLAPGGEALGGVRGCFLHMVRKEGFSSLYRGLAPALISMGPANAVFYTVYDILKSSHLSGRRGTRGGGGRSRGASELSVPRTLVYGAIAGACAETVTYPLEVIRRQLQLQRSARLGLASAFALSIEKNGVGSLFTGFVPSTLQVLPNAALSYLFYEMMKSVLKID